MTTDDPPFDPDPPGSVYVGWVKEPGKPWRRVCRAKGWDACWDMLLRVEPAAASCEKLILPDGEYPDRRRRPR